MTYARLNNIINSTLLQLGKSAHWYLDALVYARECVREMAMDDMKLVIPVLLDINDLGQSKLPSDYIDYVQVGVRTGQYMRPLVEQNSINPLPNYDNSGVQVTYANVPPADATGAISTAGLINIPVGLYWGTVVYNDYGENTGRLFGWGNAAINDTFKIIRERNIIQFNDYLGYDKAVLLYIGDGTNCTAASMVDSYAPQTITDFIKWQFKENSRTYGIGDKQWAKAQYENSRQVYRARKSDVTITNIKRSLQNNYYLVPHPY